MTIGRTFISYCRKDLDRTLLLERSLREHGLRTWIDVRNLRGGTAEGQIRSAISSEATSQGIIVASPKIMESEYAKSVEVPSLIARALKDSNFALEIVKPEAMSVDEVANLLGQTAPKHVIRQWNMMSITEVGEAPFRAVVRRSVSNLLEQYRDSTPNGVVRIGLHTLTPPAKESQDTLPIDWSHHFADGLPSEEAWRETILPAATDISEVVRHLTEDSKIYVSSKIACSACLALGSQFLSQWWGPIVFEQYTYRNGDVRYPWSLNVESKDSGFVAECQDGDPSAKDIAVILSITADARPAFMNSEACDEAFRKYVYINHQSTPPINWIEEPAHATHVVETLVQAVRDVRCVIQDSGLVHLFLAAPSGILFMVGQSLTAIGDVRVYDYEQGAGPGRYVPGPICQVNQKSLPDSTSPVRHATFASSEEMNGVANDDATGSDDSCEVEDDLSRRESSKIKSMLSRDRIKVLVFAANPVTRDTLALDREIREIKKAIKSTPNGDSIDLELELAASPDDVLHALNEHEPRVVHFSGHGSDASEILLVDDDGEEYPIGAPALRALFRTLKKNIRFAFFNACYAQGQADAITESIDCAIGMNDQIGDESAIKFAGAFYRALGFGQSVQAAFDQGIVALMFKGDEDENIPVLSARDEVDPERVFLIDP